MSQPEFSIERVEEGPNGGFCIVNPEGDDPRFWAEMTYRWQDGVMVIVHTGVREPLRGRGIARKLVEAAIATARAEGFRIEPVCPYARRVMDGDPEGYADVRA